MTNEMTTRPYISGCSVGRHSYFRRCVCTHRRKSARSPPSGCGSMSVSVDGILPAVSVVLMGCGLAPFLPKGRQGDSCPEMSVIRNLCGVKPNARNQTPSRAYTKWIPSSVLCRHDRQCGTRDDLPGGGRFLSRNGSHRINMGGSAGRTFGNRPPGHDPTTIPRY